MTRRQAVLQAALAPRVGTSSGVMEDADGEVYVVRARREVGSDGVVVWKSDEGIEVWRWGSVRFAVRKGEDVGVRGWREIERG